MKKMGHRSKARAKSWAGYEGAAARSTIERRNRRKAKESGWARQGKETPRKLNHTVYAQTTGDPRSIKATPAQARKMRRGK